MVDAVVARQQGDRYQALYFWLQACRLLSSTGRVARVGYEVNSAPRGFDDVVVWYSHLPVCQFSGR